MSDDTKKKTSEVPAAPAAPPIEASVILPPAAPPIEVKAVVVDKSEDILKVWNGGRLPFRRFERGTTPKPGDILILSDDNGIPAYIATFVEESKDEKGTYWKLTEDGKTSKAVQLVRRSLGARVVLGWLPR
jgi:hypothetical protein